MVVGRSVVDLVHCGLFVLLTCTLLLLVIGSLDKHTECEQIICKH